MNNLIKFPSQNLLPDNGEVYQDCFFLSKEESDYYFNQFLNTFPWQQDKMLHEGQRINLPRLTCWFGESSSKYSFYGIPINIHAFTNELLLIKEKIETYSTSNFNSMLAILYRNGQDHVGWHSDDEEILGLDPTIATVSLGATRSFKLKKIDENLETIDVSCQNGSLLIMQGSTQRNWQHSIPVEPKVVQPRIGLTFRKFLD